VDYNIKGNKLMTEETTIIGSFIYDPFDSFFKTKSTEKPFYELYYCGRPDSCDLLKVKQCINTKIFDANCIYGHKIRNEGPSKRSKNCRAWIKEIREMLKKHASLIDNSYPPDKMAVIGDHIYVPYSFLDMNQKIPIRQHAQFMSSGSPFIKKEDFTLATIELIVNFHPQALIGGEIKDYQTKIVPMFLTHLKERFGKLYDSLISVNPQFIEKYNLYDGRNNIGRKALLLTTKPYNNITIGKHIFEWDGERLRSVKFDIMWVDVIDQNGHKSIDEILVTVKPNKNTVIKIQDVTQIATDTIFVD
jgi:hypothetical protein